MSEKENYWRVLGKELRPHEIWEVIKWVVIAAGSAMIPTIVALWQKTRHIPLDWIVLGGLFVVSFAIFAAGIGVLLYVGRKISATAKAGSVAQEEPTQYTLAAQPAIPIRTTSAAELSPVVVPDEPTLISLSPKELISLFKTGGTSTQANRLIQPYVGKKMEVSGVVHDVDHIGPKTTQVSFTGEGLIVMYFGEKSFDPVSMLVKGEAITVRGRFESISYGGHGEIA
jgi:hypothetical protein